MSMHELLKLKISFEEIRIRGQEPMVYVVRAEEDSAWIFVTEMIEGESWDEITQKYPTLIDLLASFFVCEVWEAGSRGGNRTITISSIEGHEGLYEFDPENPPSLDWEATHNLSEVSA